MLTRRNGELYLENMRGTFTTQSNTKRNFRKSENLLREAELFSTLASIHTGFSYPKEVSPTSTLLTPANRQNMARPLPVHVPRYHPWKLDQARGGRLRQGVCQDPRLRQ